MKKGFKQIKESITKEEYKKLLHFTSNDINIKDNSKQNLLRTFTILYFTGLRLNELQQMKLQHIKELLENGVTKLILPKTKSERKLFASKEFKKELKPLFEEQLQSDTLDIRVITKKSTNSSINSDVFIKQVNSKIKEILGDGYTSHSFRQGLITQMASKGINAKIISKFIGHSDVKTTMGYIKPTDDDVKGAMIR
jgi:integrase